MGRHPGVTVIELMATLALIAVLFLVVVPSMSDLIHEQRLVTAANRLLADINYARNQAVTGPGITVVCPSADGGSCSGDSRWDTGWIVFRDPENSGQPDDPEAVLRVTEGLDRIRAYSGGRNRVRFQVDGSARGTNLTIRLCDPSGRDRHRAVIVSNPGRVRVEQRPGAAGCPSV